VAPMTSPAPLTTSLPWDLVASAYEIEVLPHLRVFSREALRLAGLPAGSRVADVACGPGTLALLAAGAGLTVEAIDFSPEMIDRLQRRLDAGRIQGVRAQLGDGQALPLADGACAGAFSLFGLMFFPDRLRGFAELRRILVPGARAVVSSWQPMERSPTLAAMFGALQEALPRAPTGPAPASTPSAVLSTPNACRAEMGKSFSEVEVHPVSSAVEFPSADALWESMERTMVPVALMRQRLGQQAWAPVSGSVRETFGKTFGAGPVTLELNALLTVGVAR